MSQSKCANILQGAVCHTYKNGIKFLMIGSWVVASRDGPGRPKFYKELNYEKNSHSPELQNTLEKELCFNSMLWIFKEGEMK